MAIVIRLKRMGKANAPFYRIVVSDDRRSAKGGLCIEELGFYNPVKNPAEVKINTEAAAKWVKEGAAISPTMKSILKRAGVELPKKLSRPKKEKKAKAKK
ncbi:MAG: 30S ribosomal protein S16 [Spirochaetia bacterium]|nr:30S ribosomal protein S16 [Spirochaetia bacterium]